jgi:hypothetical protein
MTSEVTIFGIKPKTKLNIWLIIQPILLALKCEHNRYTISYLFRHILLDLPDDGTQEVLKHVGYCVSIVFTLQCM